MALNTISPKERKRQETYRIRQAERTEKASTIILRDRTNKRIETTSNLVGAVTGIATAHYLGVLDKFKKFASDIGETYEGARAGYLLLNQGSSGRDTKVQEYLPSTKLTEQEIKDFNRRQETGYLEKLSKATSITLEATQRGSESFPGARSKPIGIIRDLSSQIMQKTMPWKNKEETEIRGTEQYTEAYNQRAKILEGLITKAGKLEESLNKQAQKISENETIGKNIKEGTSILGGLAKEYNGVMKTMEDFSGLSVKQINQGKNNEQYQTLTRQAENYGVTPGQISQNWGTGGLIVGGVAAAVIGKKLAGPLIQGITRLAMLPYRIAANKRKISIETPPQNNDKI